MSKLYFKVGSDWEEVVRLRSEIVKLKQELKSMDGTQSPVAFKALNSQLSASTQRMDELVANAAKAGTVMEGDFKKKIFDASQAVNGFTEKIIAQKEVVKNVEADVRRLGEAYRSTLKNSPSSANEKLAEYNASRKALDEEKAALFGLTQEQANARLSVKKLRDEYALYKNDGKQVAETNNGIAISWKKALAVIGGASVLKALSSEMIRVRGEFQATDTAIQTLLGSKEKADALMKQVREYAKISPLEFSDVTAATQMMLGFNIEAEKVPRFISAIGDISMGESQKFNSLTLAFSQMSATGKLMGQDMNQMINAGFNPLQAISEKTGKSIEVLKNEMSKGAISTEMVQQAFIDATSAGGKFYQMSENASKTINGQLSMMQDALDAAFNEMGTKGENVIMSGIQVTTSLIENYETVGKVLAGLVATYGVYRTAVMLITAAESKHTLVEIGLTNVRILARKAQLALNASMLTNPYVLLAVAVGGLVAANLTLIDSTRQLKAAEDSYNKTKDEAIVKEQKYNAEIDNNLSVAKNAKAAIGERKEALVKLIQEYPAVFEKYKTEAEMLQHILDIEKEIATIRNNNSTSNPKNELNEINRQITELEKLAKQRYHGGRGLTKAENTRLEMLKNKRSELEGTIKKDETDAILADLTGYSNSQIEAAIKVRERLLAKIQLKGVKKGTITGNGILSGTFTKEELEGQKILLEAAKSERESPKKSSAEWLASYKKVYDAAEKAYNDFLNSKQVMSETERDKELARLKELRDAAKTTYESKGGSVSSDNKLDKQQESAAEKLRQQQEAIRAQNDKLMTLESKQALERERQQQDLENQLAQSSIDALSDGYEKEKAQRDLNNKKEIQALKRQKEDYIRAYVQAQKEIFDAEEELKAKKTKGDTKQTFDSSTINVDDIIAAWDKIIQNTETQQGVDEWQRREDAMNEYLVEYGTFAQKKEAIDKKYQAAIDKETDLGAKNTLRKKWDEALSALNVDKLKQEINWELVFGDLSNASKESLKKVKKQLKEFRNSSEYQSMDLENKKIVDEALNNIQTAIIDKGGLLGDLPAQLTELRIAQEELNKAQQEYNEAMEHGTDVEKEAATKKKNAAEINLQNAGINVQKSTDKTVSNLNAVAGAMQQLSGTDVSLSSIGSAVENLVSVLGKSESKIGGIIAAILSILDVIGDKGITDFVTDLVSNVMSSLRDAAIKDIEKTSLGLLDMSFFKGADYTHYNDMVEEYTNLNKIWDELIDKKKEYIDISYGAEANKVGREALELVEKSIESYRILGKERLNAGASTGSHSIGVRIRKGMSQEGWNEAKSVLGSTFNEKSIGDGRMTGLFDLSVEQLEKLRYEAPTFWAKLDGDVSDYLNKIIEGTERIEDIKNQVKEQLTQTTFDTVFSSFVDTLMDMDSSAKDFSNSFSEYMQRAMLTTMVGDKFSDDLQKWYDAFAKANDDKDGITKEEMDALKSQYDTIVNSALSERDKLAEIFEWTNEDTANYENFISNMQSAFTSLDVTAKDVSNNIYDYFRQAMINALYEKEYKSKMEELYKTFDELSKDGLSESDMAQLGSQVDQYIEQMMKGVEDVNSLFADKLKDNEDLQSFVDNIKSAMSSIEATAEDVTDNIFEYIRQQMVEKMFADTFQPQIEEFYKKVQDAMSDGDITDAERNALRSEAEKLANDITAAKDILSDTLGITESSLKKELEEEFKSFSDGILNSLYNAEVTAESVAKDIAESMRKELIEAMYIEQYEPRIKAIWEKWKEYSADGLVTDEERANIKTDIDELSKEVSDAAKEISDAWTDSGEEVKKAFESFSDSIKNVLYDAEATAEDVANNIYQYMRNALVDSMFTAQLQPQIQAWYDKYTEFMKDGAIDTAERKTLDEMIAEIQKAGVDIVDAANALFPSLDTGAIKRAEEAAQEAENARNEAEQEWESFSDGILNSLYDIEATAEDISDDMSEYMRKALIKAMYVENFKPQMQKWYNEWQRAMGDDNLTSEEKQLLDSMKQTMVDDMKKEVDAINQFFGTMFSQQASSKGFEAMSQDTGEELNGRFTALQVAGEEIKNQAVQQTGLLSSIDKRLSLIDITNDDIPALMSGTPNFVDKTRGIITNSYQSQINVVFPTEDIKVLTDKVSSMERIVDEMRTFQVEGNIARRDIVENSAILAKNSPKILAGTDEIKRNLKNL